MAAPLPAAPKLITFDTYGTLIDWDSALRRYVVDLLTRHGSNQDAASFHYTWYYEYAVPTLSGRFQIYRELLSTALQAAFAATDVSISDDEAAGIGDAMAAADPFSDSVEALGVLRQHAPLATISNSQQTLSNTASGSSGAHSRTCSRARTCKAISRTRNSSSLYSNVATPPRRRLYTSPNPNSSTFRNRSRWECRRSGSTDIIRPDNLMFQNPPSCCTTSPAYPPPSGWQTFSPSGTGSVNQDDRRERQGIDPTERLCLPERSGSPGMSVQAADRFVQQSMTADTSMPRTSIRSGSHRPLGRQTSS